MENISTSIHVQDTKVAKELSRIKDMGFVIKNNIVTKPDKLIILYVNNFSYRRSDKIIMDHNAIRDFYVNIIKYVIRAKITITGHFGNSLIIRSDPKEDLCVSKILKAIVSDALKYNLRIGVHMINHLEVDIAKLNKDIKDRLLYENISVDDLIPAWPLLKKLNVSAEIIDCANRLSTDEVKKCPTINNLGDEFHFFDEDEIFDKDIYFAQFLATFPKEPRIVISLEVFKEILNEYGMDKGENKDHLVSKINIINDKLKDISIGIPFPIFQNNSFSYASYVYDNNKNESGYEAQKHFFKDWRKEKTDIEKIYIAYFKISDGEVPYAITNRKDEIINTLNERRLKDSPMDSKELLYFDSIFKVDGYVMLNTKDPDFPIKESLQKSVGTIEYMAKTLIAKYEEPEEMVGIRIPHFVILSSFPNSEDENYFRKEMNKIFNNVYFRTEDIYNGGEFLSYYDEINSRLPNEKSDIQRHELPSEDITKDFLNINENNQDKDDFVLIIFNLESKYLSSESDKTRIFEKVIQYTENNKYSFEKLSNEKLKVCSYGILRGSWDGYLLLHYRDPESPPFLKLLEKILFIISKKESFLGEVTANLELFWLKKLNNDYWTSNLISASVNNYDKKRRGNNEKN